MTLTPAILGSTFDATAILPDAFQHYEAKRSIVLARLNLAESEGDPDTATIMKWELGLLDLNLAVQEGVSPFGGGEYDRYAAHYAFTKDTADYARERATET